MKSSTGKFSVEIYSMQAFLPRKIITIEFQLKHKIFYVNKAQIHNLKTDPQGLVGHVKSKGMVLHKKNFLAEFDKELTRTVK